MSNCPECGEKIADLDIFCSYCGISLTPVAPEPEDPSLSATIVASPREFPAPDVSVNAPANVAIPAPIPSPFAPSGGDPISSTDESLESVVAEMPAAVAAEPSVPDLRSAVEDVPTPKVILDLESARVPQSGEVEEVRKFAEVREVEEVGEVTEEPVAEPVAAAQPEAVSEFVPVGEVAEVREVREVEEVGEVTEEPVAEPVAAAQPEAVSEFVPVGEVREVAEVEEVEAVEEVAEEPVAEPVAAAQPEAVSEFTPVGEVEEVGEIGTIEAVEEVGTVEEVAVVTEAEEVTEEPVAEPVAPAQPEAVSEFTPVGKVEAVEDVGTIEAVEEVAEVTEKPVAEPVAAAQPEAVSEFTPVGKVEEVAEVREVADETPLEKSFEITGGETPIDDLPVDPSAIKSFEIMSDVIPEPELPLTPGLPFVEAVSPVDESESLPEPAAEPVAKIEAPTLPAAEDAPVSDTGETAMPEAAAVADEGVRPEIQPEQPPSSTKPNFGNGDTDGRKAAKLKPLDEGKVLNNRYEIVRKIGGGGMGAVYLANDRNLGGILRAVKEMVQSYIESEQQDKAIADFQREAMILTNLEHPSIPTIYDYFFDETEGRFYLVMKYISGGDLSARLRANPEGRLDEKTVTEFAIQIADVLDYLHQQDPVIVYRDLKPANIMIDGNSGRLMLIDFGIARSINKEEKGVTAVGTMGYAPPELFSGNVEPRSDIYSLGSTMFHLLTGADPQSNPLLIFDFQKNPRPRQINSQLSDQIEQIIMRSVEYNADMRFRSAGELRGALEEHLMNLRSGKLTYGVKAAPSAVSFSEQLVFCGFCGKQIVASDVFCAFCGSQQPIAQQSFHQAPVMAAPAATAKLYVILTNDLDSSGFTLEKDENLIGRRDPMSNIFPEVDLSKFDPQTKISRRHARVRREGSSFLLEDLGSSNGTILMSGTDSARLLPHQPRLLTNGDRFRVGDTTLQFSIG